MNARQVLRRMPGALRHDGVRCLDGAVNVSLPAKTVVSGWPDRGWP